VRASGTDEQLLVQSLPDALGLALFLDAALLARLERSDPLSALHDGNIGDYWTVLEGVSHFVCLAWNAHHDRDVSLLELELQAEIDKYVTTYVLLRRHQPRRFPAELHRLLFERTRVDAVLAGERAGLYRAATRYAARYCRRIERRLQDRGDTQPRWPGADLRRFYRMPDLAKLSYIEALEA
jgi:hypothetical protein